MKRLSRVLVSTVAALVLSSPVSAQLLGNVLGGVRGTVGGAVNQVGGLTSGALGSASGGVDRTVGGLSSSLGGLTGGGLSGGGGVLGLGGGQSSLLGRLSGSRSSSLSDAGLTTGPDFLNYVGGPYDVASASPEQIDDYRRARLNALIMTNRRVLDRDQAGDPVRRYELIATNPDAISLANAVRAGFQLVARQQQPELGLNLVTLSIPRRMNVRQAYQALHRAAPAMQVDFNHIYEPSGGSLLPVAGAVLASSPRRHHASARAKASARPMPAPMRIAIIDGGVASHPSLARAAIVQQGFAGSAQPTGHGTAVGSLLVGEQGPFRGAARGAQLFVGDVYGGSPAAGSVTSIVQALNWAASKNPTVINISLVGPSNVVLAKAIAAVRARGIQVVAAVGNDGPAAPPQYPASYPGVIAVTGVDGHGRALPEAGKSTHLDFAAPGADMLAAYPGYGFTSVRGTSFAAPLAAARLALAGSYQKLAMEAQPGKGKVGRGIVCGQCRIAPRSER